MSLDPNFPAKMPREPGDVAADPARSAELTSLRVVYLGNTFTPTGLLRVRLQSDSEERPFLAACTLETSRQLLRHRNREIQADLYIERDAEKRIRHAYLESFTVPTDGNGLAIWRDSFRSKIREWDAIDDLDKHLGRLEGARDA